MDHSKTIFRVDVEGLHCKSSRELVILKVIELDGVEAVSFVGDSTLAVYGGRDAVNTDDIVRSLVDVGVVPLGDFTVVQAVEEVPAEIEVVAEVEVETPVAAEAPAETPVTVAAEPVVVEALEPVAVAAVEAQAQTVPGPIVHSLAAETTADPVAAAVVEAAEIAAEVAAEAVAEAAEAENFAKAMQADIELQVAQASPRASLVQHIRVTVADSYYPNRITVIAGIPVEIEFSEGHGCLARVLFEQFGIDQDLTQGGATVRLPGLVPGSYPFSCGMHMVYGTVVAEA